MRLLRLIGLIVACGILTMAVSCGGAGNKANLPTSANPPSSEDVSGNDSTTPSPPDLSGTYLTEAPRTEIDPNAVLVKTGDTKDEFSRVASKYGYEVEFKVGNWIKVRVPDGNIDRALAELRKEYTVFSAEPNFRYVMPRDADSPKPNVRVASYLPFDSLYADRAVFPTGYDANQNIQYSTFYAQRVYMAPMSFEGAWDVAIRDGVRTTPVTVAIIDAGIFRDPDSGGLHPDLDTGRIAAGSGTIAEDGTFTPDEYYWEVDANGDPYRATGNKIVGLFASRWNNLINWTTQVGDPPLEAQFTASLTPLTPFASVMIVKTGRLVGSNWTFSDAEIANSINHAVDNGANVILLGMWAEAPVAGPVQDAVNNARSSDVLVVAPAGMSQLDTSDPDPLNWTWGTPGNVSAVTPASADGVVSVMGTGFEQIDGDDPEAPPPGYANFLIPNIGDAWNEIASYSYTGADIAAVGWGTGWSYNFFNLGINVNTSPAVPGSVDIAFASAYVAAAASIAYQGLVNANGGVPPTDVDTIIENLLLSEALTLPGGEPFLVAGSVAHVANNGGYNQILQPVDITNVQISGGFFVGNTAFIETNQEVQFAVSMTSSAGGFELAVGWGDGTLTPADGNPVAYTPGDPVAHTFTEAGSYVINFLAEDADGFSDVFAVYAEVYDGLSVNLSVRRQDLTVVPGSPPQLDYEGIYIIDAGANYKTITGNVINCEWDFNYTGNPDEFDPEVTGDERFVVLFSYGPPPPSPNPAIQYLNLGRDEDYTIALRVTQTRRPTLTFEFNVSVGG